MGAYCDNCGEIKEPAIKHKCPGRWDRYIIAILFVLIAILVAITKTAVAPWLCNGAY